MSVGERRPAELGLPDGPGFTDIGTASTVAFGCTIVILAQSAATARGSPSAGRVRRRQPRHPGSGRGQLRRRSERHLRRQRQSRKTRVLDEQRARSQVANLTMAVATLLGAVPQAMRSPTCRTRCSARSSRGRRQTHRRPWVVRIFRGPSSELATAAFAAVMVIVFVVQTGIVVAMVVSLLALIRRQYRPDRAWMITVSDGGKRAFLPARPGLQSLPGLIIFRYDADLFYANANRFSDDVQGLLRSAPTPVNWLVLDCAAIGASTIRPRRCSAHSSTTCINTARISSSPASIPSCRRRCSPRVCGRARPDHVFASVGAAVQAYRG